MRRLLAAVAVVLSASPAHATYAGQVRTATATFRLRGTDGHLLTLAFTVRASGLGGTADFQQAALALTDCAGARCATSRWVTPVTTGWYAASDDLSVTEVTVRLGTVFFGIGWSAAAGYGALPPSLADGGYGVTTGRSATAFLLAGPRRDAGHFDPVARCAGTAVRVTSAVGVFADPPRGAWPASPPHGLRVTATSRRFFWCA